MKLTPWYPPYVVPVRKGVYEVRQPGWYSYWNGEGFNWQDCKGPEQAYVNRSSFTACSPRQSWRGLAKEPK